MSGASGSILGDSSVTLSGRGSEDNITMQVLECALHERVSFHGEYDNKACGITLQLNNKILGHVGSSSMK